MHWQDFRVKEVQYLWMEELFDSLIRFSLETQLPAEGVEVNRQRLKGEVAQSPS